MAYYSEGKDLRGTELDRQVKARKGQGGSSSGLSDEDLLKKYGG